MKVKLHWGAGVAAAYAVFAIATVLFVVFAIRQPVDLVSADYYAEGLRQDQRVAAVENARQLGTAVSVSRTAAGHLGVRIPQEQAASAHGQITLYRASDARADRTMDLRVAPDGRQDIAIDGLATGHWMVRLAWTALDRTFYYETRLEIDE